MTPRRPRAAGAIDTAFEPYAPLDVLKPIAEDIWLVDGPEIRFGYAGLKLPFPTRMTVVRLPGGDLWLHSPTRPSDELVQRLGRLGRVRFLIAPNTLHYWWIPEWQALFPRAEVYGAPGLKHAAKRELFIQHVLSGDPPPAWDGPLAQVLVQGPMLAEVVFFHRPSRTLILTDLIENFEVKRARAWWLRLILRASGAADPDGKAPIDMQLSFLRRRRSVKAAVETMIAWNPERLIMAHGRWYPRDATAELKRAFRWVLDA